MSVIGTRFPFVIGLWDSGNRSTVIFSGASRVDVMMNIMLKELSETSLCSDVAVFLKKCMSTWVGSVFINDRETVESADWDFSWSPKKAEELMRDLLCRSQSGIGRLHLKKERSAILWSYFSNSKCRLALLIWKRCQLSQGLAYHETSGQPLVALKHLVEFVWGGDQRI